ncbi:lipoyl protein ligase domain-containing protein [Lautropia mirabilis]
MNIPSLAHEGHGEGLSLTGEAKDVLDLDAAREQRWNERQLAEPVLHPRMKVWTYREGAIVLGRSQHALADRPAAGSMSDAAADDAGGVPPDGLADSGAVRLPLVKRGAGGGAVLVGPWLLSASLLLPLDDPRMAMTSVADSYRWLGEAMVETLAELGVMARTVPPAERIPAPERLAWACFAGVAPWEVVVDDPTTGVARKLVGFAQRRSRHGVLLALGVLVQPAPWRLLAQTLGHPVALADELAATTVDLASVSPRPVSNDDFLAALWPRLQPMSLMPD